MTTRSLIQKKLADLYPNIFRKDINASISIILETIISEVKNDSRVELRHFGSFFLKEFKHKTARNPKTGAIITFDNDRRTMRFRVSKIFLKRLNENFTQKKISYTP